LNTIFDYKTPKIDKSEATNSLDTFYPPPIGSIQTGNENRK
jgi:hypothetical protein